MLNDFSYIAKCIIEKQYKRIALQFPDDLLSESPNVATFIEAEIKKQDANYNGFCLFILADSAVNSHCCIDEIAAAHYQADCIVHFGNACYSTSSMGTSVIYSVPYVSFDQHYFLQELQRNKILTDTTSLIIFYDTAHSYTLPEIIQCLHDYFLNHEDHRNNILKITIAITKRVQTSRNDNISITGFLGREFLDITQLLKNNCDKEVITTFVMNYILDDNIRLNEERNSNEISINVAQKLFDILSMLKTSTVLYIGNTDFNECSFFKRFLLRLGTDYRVYAYNPSAECPAILDSTYWKIPLQRFLMFRYGMIEAARCAEKIGLIYGTISIAFKNEIHNHLQGLCKKAGRKTLSLVVGKITVSKLENFPDIDAFCMLACPESSFLINSREFSKPIVTPFELEIALGAREWDTEYFLDFDELLLSSSSPEVLSSDCPLPDDNYFNNMQLQTRFSQQTLKSNNNNALVSTTASQQLMSGWHKENLVPLKSRTFQGVPLYREETSLNDQNSINASTIITQGKCGIASAYDEEKKLM